VNPHSDTPIQNRPPRLSSVKVSGFRNFLSIFLSIYLAVFALDAFLSILDDSLRLFFGFNLLSGPRNSLGVGCLLIGLLVYLGMSFTPLIKKRYFLPLILLAMIGNLAVFPVMIYHFDKLMAFSLILSLIHGALTCIVLFSLQGGLRLRWPLVSLHQLGTKPFSWLNLGGFLLANLLVIPLIVLIYLGCCASAAAGHFSGNFLKLDWSGLTARSKTYVRDDGKTIHLIPMMHIGQSDFYKKISQSIPSDSIILMEGVTDEKHHLKNKLSYNRIAKTLGLVEQKEEFIPKQATKRSADVDVDQFSAKTLEFLDLVIAVHSKGIDPITLQALMKKGEDPLLIKQIFHDLLTLRNEHLIAEIQKELLKSNTIVVPWGAAHMKEIAQGIEKDGFHETQSQEHHILAFRGVKK
jgi:hypothetical protein